MSGNPLSKPHSRDLRKGRYSAAGNVYVVTFATHRRRPVLHGLWCARAVVRCLYTARAAHTLCHVVMPDHAHWLFRLEGPATLSQTVQLAKSVSARRINRLHGTTGRVWQPGYHDHALRRNRDLRSVARYIVANPLRGKLVRRLGDYPHWDACWL